MRSLPRKSSRSEPLNRGRSWPVGAGCQPDVSQVANLPGRAGGRDVGAAQDTRPAIERPADWQSAKRQAGSLRYARAAPHGRQVHGKEVPPLSTRLPLAPTLSPSDGAREQLPGDCVPTNRFGMHRPNETPLKKILQIV